jgi:hypothetical protein
MFGEGHQGNVRVSNAVLTHFGRDASSMTRLRLPSRYDATKLYTSSAKTLSYSGVKRKAIARAT